MIDFKKKLASSKIEKRVDPFEIYDSLDRKSITGPLRPAQNEILRGWASTYTQKKDLIIKLHTGEGKTLIGLLILNSKQNELNQPSVFVCPNKYLVSQVLQEAEKFGIPVCTIEKDNSLPNDFLNSKKILVTHAHKIFNGKSIFGIGTSSTSVGSIVLDDSHACIDAIKDSFSIKLPKSHPGYLKLLNLFEETLRDQGEGSYREVESGSLSTILLVPYWSWMEKVNEVTQILSVYKEDNEIKFVWPLIKDSISKCQAVVSGVEFEITPYQIPLDRFGIFTNARQRILMSATTQDDSFFIKGLGFSIESVQHPLTISNQKWSGEKMIIIPSLIDEELSREVVINKFAKPSEKNFGILAIVPSAQKAAIYKQLGGNVSGTSNIFNNILDLKNGRYRETQVILNRYDGIDLPDESCRILILDSMPYFSSLSERYEELCRSTSDIINIKLAQKIEQGLGRSVRGEKDFTVILIIGPDLVKFIKSVKTNKYFSQQSRKQIEIGLDIADMANADTTAKKTEDLLSPLIKQCLQRDEGWKEFYKSKMDELEPNVVRPTIYELLQIEKECEMSFSLGDYEASSRKMQSLIDGATLDEYEKGWYLQSLARYKYQLSKLESNSIQKNAFTKNPHLLKPKDGIVYKKIGYINQNRINRIKDYQQRFPNNHELMLEINSVLDNLTFGVEAEKFENALYEVGLLLGFVSQRPDREIGKGPDNLWCAGENKYIMFECKSEVDETREEIIKSEASQMDAHCGWFETQYGDSEVKRIMVIPTKNLSYQADFTHPVEIMRKGKLREFKTNIKSFTKEFAPYNLNEISDDKIDQFIKIHKLMMNDIYSNYTEAYFHRPGK